jgi:hypothetical protein
MVFVLVTNRFRGRRLTACRVPDGAYKVAREPVDDKRAHEVWA